MRHAKSLGYMGPYDGHGKRGRNIISRIKEDSASSTSEDDDEHTNRTVNARSLKYNSRNSLGSGKCHLLLNYFCLHYDWLLS